MLFIINYDLIRNVLAMAIINSLIVINLVQKVKESFHIKCSSVCIFISLGISLVISTLFSLTFSNLSFIASVWSGLISFLGADFLYQILEGKLFKSLGDIKIEKVEESTK